MTANNGWPGKPGVPMHPEKDGDHWLKSALTGEMYLFKWKAEKFYSCGQPQILPHWVNHPMWQVQEMIYLGPALTPDEAAALQKRVAELEGAIRTAAECIDADDTIAARGFLSDVLIKKYKPKWVCPNNTPGCLKNCGNYGCGN